LKINYIHVFLSQCFIALVILSLAGVSMEEQALLICSFLYPHNPLSNFGHVNYVMKPSENTKIKRCLHLKLLHTVPLA
jgi:hypothetical protein